MSEPTGTHPFAPFEWMLSLRYLRARRKEGFISVIAGFSFLGIMLGVATLIIVMAVMNGFRQELLTKILGLNGHLLIQPLESPLTDWEAVADRVSKIDGIKLAAPIVEGQALASSPFNASGVLVRGIRSVDLTKLTSIAKNIKQGTLDGFDQGQGLAIGNRLAEQLSVRAGDNLTLVAPRGAVTPMGTTPRIKAYKIAAVFEIGMSEYDAAFVFMPLTEAQAYFNRTGDVTAIEVYTDDPDHIDGFRKAVNEAAARPIYMVDWRQRNATFFGALQVERNVMFLILTLIVLVAALNIVSGLIMLVKDKGSDIAILRTMGATQGAIMRVFLITGAAIGFVGTAFGFMLGTIVCLNIEFDPALPVVADQYQPVPAGTVFSVKASGRYERARNHRRRRHGARAVAVGDALSVVAGGAARSGRSAALRMIDQAAMDDTTTISEAATSTAEKGEYPLVFLHGICRQFHQGDATLDILKSAELAVWAGQSVALVAPSGAGKSTLLHIAGLLEHPDSGEVYIDGAPTTSLSDIQRTRIRRNDIGFVYQFHHLLPEFTALENVMLPQMVRGLGRNAASERAAELLSYLGLKDRLNHRPAELSGGEQQRVAIARAVANAPRILLADEPTGNLDVHTADHVFGALRQLVRATGLAAVIATHNLDIAAQMDRRVTIREGLVVELE